LKKFLQYKRGLGYRYITEEQQASWLDKLSVKMEIDKIGFTKEQAEIMCRKDPNEKDKTRQNHIIFLRQFSLFLKEEGYQSFVPTHPPFKSSYTPYIFTKEEIAAIFHVSDNFKTNFHNATSCVYAIPTLFRVLYGTGMRIGEATKLSISDVDMESKTLTLRECKNGKDRLVPMSDSLAAACQQYYSYRMNRQRIKNVNEFFISHDGYALTNERCYNWFRKILFVAGISHKGKGFGPRLHDLRHTFSVHSLLAMSEAGVDLYYSLPVLSTYLGHESIKSTDKYVRLTTEMYPALVQKINNNYPQLFPKIFKDIEDETN
jgi:site-specific recombinase XerD